MCSLARGCVRATASRGRAQGSQLHRASTSRVPIDRLDAIPHRVCRRINMNIEIIIGCEMHPQQVAEFAVEAEKAGVRTLWHSNLPNGWDPFIGLSQAALATSRIKLGVLALSPYEMHPVRIAYSLISLNELCRRARHHRARWRRGDGDVDDRPRAGLEPRLQGHAHRARRARGRGDHLSAGERRVPSRLRGRGVQRPAALQAELHEVPAAAGLHLLDGPADAAHGRPHCRWHPGGRRHGGPAARGHAGHPGRPCEAHEARGGLQGRQLLGLAHQERPRGLDARGARRAVRARRGDSAAHRARSSVCSTRKRRSSSGTSTGIS